MPTVKPDRNCDRCPLHEHAQTVCLMGRGPIPSEVMLIGEAPGYREDDIGRPFSGAAGQEVLDPALEEIGVNRKEVYITNVVRCRPPDNRTPRAAEIKACSRWMRKELRLVKPKYVLLMGKTALKLVPQWARAKLGEVRGKTTTQDGITFLATYHPAACLPGRDRRGKQLSAFSADLNAFFRMAKGQLKDHRKELNLRYVLGVDDFNDLIDSIDKHESYIGFDTETMGLNQWQTDSHITSMQFALEHEQWYLPWWAHHTRFWRKAPFHTDSIRNKAAGILYEVLKDKKLATQGGKFDMLWLRVEHKIRLYPWVDTLPLSVLLDENTPHSLSYMATKYFDAPDYDIKVSEKQGYDISMRKHAKYGCLDTYYTRLLVPTLLQKLDRDLRLKNFFWTVWMPMYRNYIDIQANGVYVNPERFKESKIAALDAEGTAISKLNSIKPNSAGLPKSSIRVLKKRGIFYGLNWNSPKQLARFLFKELKLPSLEKTKTGNDSTNESVLKRLALLPRTDGDRLIIVETVTKKTHNLRVHPEGDVRILFKGYKQDVPQLVIDYRKAKKMREFFDSWTQHFDPKNRMHPNFKLETVTGRASTENPNIQQTPRNPKIRSCVESPGGFVHVAADYSQVELRFAAMFANERTMKYVFQTGGDIHAETVKSVFKILDFTSEERKRAKAVNFGFIYGMGWRKFQAYARDKYEQVFDEEESQDVREAFFSKYSSLIRWHDKQRRLVHRNGYVRTFMGRKRRLPTIYSADDASVHEAERQAINSPVQGSAAELHYAAANDIRKLFRKHVKISGTIHDELLMWVRKASMSNQLMTDIKETMEEPSAVRKLGIRYTVPIEVEMKVGPWGKGKVWVPSS